MRHFADVIFCFTFRVQLRQWPSQQVLFLVVGSCAFSLLLQEILLSPPLRVVFPQCWNLKFKKAGLVGAQHSHGK